MTSVKILPDPPAVCVSNLLAEALMIEQHLDSSAPSSDPSAFRIDDSDLQRIAKTMRRAAELLKPKLAARAAAEAILCPHGWALPLGSGITSRTICDAIHAYHEASKSDVP